MKHLSEMKKRDLKKIKLIVFDVDGVLVPRGTRIKQKGNVTTLETKIVPREEIDLIKKLRGRGFHLNINSGRGLYMLQEMFRPVLDFVSLTYENGSATWINGKVHQHVNSFQKLNPLVSELKKIKHKDIKGFEPKEFVITIHCKKRVMAIENFMKKQRGVYSIWNDEAYDIGLKKIQTKSVGLINLRKLLKLKKKNVLAIGDNYNDLELLKEAGIAISADVTRVKGDFFIELSKRELPAGALMRRILTLK